MTNTPTFICRCACRDVFPTSRCDKPALLRSTTGALQAALGSREQRVALPFSPLCRCVSAHQCEAEPVPGQGRHEDCCYRTVSLRTRSEFSCKGRGVPCSYWSSHCLMANCHEFHVYLCTSKHYGTYMYIQYIIEPQLP